MKRYLLAALLTGVAHADVMNLNEFMPTRIVDAVPMKASAWDLQWSTAFEEDWPSDVVVQRPVVRYGAHRRFQLEVGSTITSGGEEINSGDVELGGQYQLNESIDWFPIFSLSPFFILPTGKFSQGEDFGYLFAVTTTLRGVPSDPATQFHFNLRHTYNDNPRDAERRNRYEYAVGMAQKLTQRSALVMDMILQEERIKGEVANLLEAGIHQELGLGWQLGVSLAAGVGEDSPSWTANLGVEKQF